MGKPLFSRLDATGLFHRDSRVGRVFHPGTVSYRQISQSDSLHIAVTPENHVSVHVDRVSPLAFDGSRYTLVRVLHHNVTHGVDAWDRLRHRRSGDHRCELDCDIVAVTAEPEDEAPVMYEFSCMAAGAEGCNFKARAPSEEELLVQVAEHARKVHGINGLTRTLANYIGEVSRSA